MLGHFLAKIESSHIPSLTVLFPTHDNTSLTATLQHPQEGSAFRVVEYN